MACKRFILALSLLAVAAGVWADESTELFKKAAGGSWSNPVTPVGQDMRRPPDLGAFFKSGKLALYAPEYFPAWAMGVNAPELTLFEGMDALGLGGPTRLALSCQGKTEVFPAGTPLDANKLAAMDRPWMLLWFTGAKGWRDFDFPLLLVLQRQPVSAAWSGGALRLTFKGDAGLVFLMPLFGYYKPPQADRSFADPAALPNIRPREWENNLPSAVAKRCDYFSSLCRCFPYFLKDSFQVDLKQNALKLHYEFLYHLSQDDWKTPPAKLAPLSPTLALAIRNGFPAKFDATPFDPVYPTTLGPWTGVQDADSYDLSLLTLQYLAETFVYDLNPDTSDPLALRAVSRLTLKDQEPPARTSADPVVDIFNSDRFKALSARYADPAARAKLKQLFTEEYLAPGRFRERSVSGSKFLFLGQEPYHPDSPGHVTAALFENLWIYSFNTGDYAWLSGGGARLERLASPLAALAWARAGDGKAVELGLGAGPALAYARLMYLAHDQRNFAWGAFWSTMEMLRVFVKCGPMGDYARDFQPWNGATPLGPRANATVCDPAHGWEIGGPGDDPGKGALWRRRWNMMTDFDLDRFLRENSTDVAGGLRHEFDTWLKTDFAKLGPDARFPASSDPWTNPAKLLSLYKEFLGESADRVRTRMGGWTLSWEQLEAASADGCPSPWVYWAFADVKRYERILDADVLPFTPGYRSLYPSPPSDLVFSAAPSAGLAAPAPCLPRWAAPNKGEASWGFGRITPCPGAAPSAVKPSEDGNGAAYSW